MGEVRISRVALMKVLETSPAYFAYARGRAMTLKELAVGVFRSRQRRDNEERTSETTPPKYVVAWEINRQGSLDIVLVNTDRSAMWVEFGAHAGGETPVLRYKPLTTALEILGNQTRSGD